MATIKDVAKQAGVSMATVSRVIRGEKNVSTKKQKLVEDAINALNYQPNMIARQLRQKETRTVIVIIPDIKNTFFHEIILGIEQVAYQHEYQVLLADMQNNPQVEEYYFNSLMQRQVDGIISLSANVARRFMEQVSSSYPVVIACQYMEDSDLPNVTIDNVAASKRMMQHLIDLGFRRIGHLTSHQHILLYRDRLTGYCQSLAENRIPIDMELVRYGESSIQSGYEQMCALLDQKKQVDAVFAAGDVMAVGAMRALAEHGKQVPQDCAVVGFDDIELSSICVPSLTTIRQPTHIIGIMAMEMLCELMADRDLVNRQVVLDFELVIRESCGRSMRAKQK